MGLYALKYIVNSTSQSKKNLDFITISKSMFRNHSKTVKTTVNV